MADTKVFSFPEQGGYNNNGGFLNGNGWGERGRGLPDWLYNAEDS